MGYWDVGPFDNSAARDVVEAIRAGRFNLDQFIFDCTGENELDADLGAGIVALLALLDDTYELPPGIACTDVTALDTPRAWSWLRGQRLRVLNPEKSGLYAFWEQSGQLQDWLAVTTPIGRPGLRKLHKK
ncbi:DUF4259 domain-containing protein [Corynebacterium lubricantis]|uniref:DUF4259 domain-containing protein n=1 Tax=Corynebacterium lubricantis TaxID=541095 RepID=UPI000360860E|nr:DUF4259 domain-containing protein [Corynebacterium lubricantis]